MVHSFDVEIAKILGINEAIILNSVLYWIEKNKANNSHFHDNYYWTYNSLKGWEELFPYMSKKTIQRTIDRLVSEGYLLKGNYNELPFDRTCWYALTDKAYDLVKTRNAFSQNDYISFSQNDQTNTNIITNNNKETISKDIVKKVEEIVEYLNDKCGTNYKATTNATKTIIKARLNEGFKVEDFKKVIDIKSKDWLNDDKMQNYLRPQTLFGNKFENYLNSKDKQQTNNNNNTPTNNNQQTPKYYGNLMDLFGEEE